MEVSKRTYEGPAISVVSHSYCLPHPFEFIVNSKVERLSNRHIDACDLSGDLLLEVDGSFWHLNKKRIMRTEDGFPILTMLQEYSQTSWKAYEGGIERSKKKKYSTLFSVHQIDIWNFNVFLASKSKKESCDFHVCRSSDDMSFKVYHGKTIIAEWGHNSSKGSLKLRGSYWVKVYPEVDYAFIMALLSIICIRH